MYLSLHFSNDQIWSLAPGSVWNAVLFPASFKVSIILDKNPVQMCSSSLLQSCKLTKMNVIDFLHI